jgi:hypothetical protein
MLANAQTSAVRPRRKNGDDDTAIEMAELFVTNERRGYPTTLDDLEAAGFSGVDITLHVPAARRIAREAMADRDVSQSPVDYDPIARIEKAAGIMAGVVGAGEGVIFDALRREGFATRELGNLYPRIIARCCEILVAQQQPQAEAAN